MNSKFFKQWMDEAYYEWLTEERCNFAGALVSLAEDVKEKAVLCDWARDTRIPEILLEIKELDDEIKAREAAEEAEG